MSKSFAICQRELSCLLASSTTYVLLTIFLIVSGVSVSLLSEYDGLNQDALISILTAYPWALAIIIPIFVCNMWSSEQTPQTSNLLSYLSVNARQVVMGKYFATCAIVFLFLIFSMPLWLAVNYFDTANNWYIGMMYVSNLVLVGVFAAICMFLVALFRRQVSSLLVSIGFLLLLLIVGTQPFMTWVQMFVTEQQVVYLNHLRVVDFAESLQGAKWSLTTLTFYFVSMITFLIAACIALPLRKEQGSA